MRSRVLLSSNGTNRGVMLWSMTWPYRGSRNGAAPRNALAFELARLRKAAGVSQKLAEAETLLDYYGRKDLVPQFRQLLEHNKRQHWWVGPGGEHHPAAVRLLPGPGGGRGLSRVL